MSRTDWVNTNKNRLYPFDATGAATIGTLTVPRELLADAGFVLGVRAAMPEGTRVWLYEIQKAAGTWTVIFQYGGSHEFVFTLTGTEPEGTTIFVDATPIGAGSASSESSSGAEDFEYGTAFIVLGDLEVATVASGSYTQWTPNDSWVLPALVQTLQNHYVRRIHLANDPGVDFLTCGDTSQHYTPAGDCKEAVVMARNFSGDVKMVAGYNARVGLVLDDNRLVLGSGIGLGEGVPCEEVSRDPSGVIPTAPTCEDLLYMINGVSPNADGEFTIRAGKGFEIATTGNVLTVTPDDHAYCTDLWVSESG